MLLLLLLRACCRAVERYTYKLDATDAGYIAARKHRSREVDACKCTV
jgi:hypothetical protein